MKKGRRSVEAFSISFLDVITAGFGAIILLLIISKVAEPVVIEKISADLDGVVAELEQQIHELRGETTVLNRDLKALQPQLSEEQRKLARLQGDLSAVRGRFAAERQSFETQAIIEGQLVAARQQLSEEMRRLLGQSYRRTASDSTVGGVPVDSEYIIFIIDTSGSMFQNAWPLVIKKISETLDIYPKLKGIQVMNDMGDYMFSQYAGKWIPDTPARRSAILNRLKSWSPFSNSSPVEGITKAIRQFYAGDKKISLYVFGDEFSRGSLEAVVQEVDAINKADKSGNRRVRIHAVGFPVQFAAAGNAQATGIRFAALMRILSQKNGGTFVGLNSYQP